MWTHHNWISLSCYQCAYHEIIYEGLVYLATYTCSCCLHLSLWSMMHSLRYLNNVAKSLHCCAYTNCFLLHGNNSCRLLNTNTHVSNKIRQWELINKERWSYKTKWHFSFLSVKTAAGSYKSNLYVQIHTFID